MPTAPRHQMAARRALTFAHEVQAGPGSSLLGEAILDMPVTTFAVTAFELQMKHRSPDAWLKHELDAQVRTAKEGGCGIATGNSPCHTTPCRHSLKARPPLSLLSPVETSGGHPRPARGSDDISRTRHPTARFVPSL
jgi:hypothetical protein